MRDVNEIVEVAKLELERRPGAVSAHDPSGLTDDPETVLRIALMIVRQIQNEQIGKIETGLHVFFTVLR